MIERKKESNMEVTLKLIEKDFTMHTGGEVSFIELTEMFLNGIILSMEKALEARLEMEDNKSTEEELRSQLHDMMVISFSTAMNHFDPKAVNYKTAAEDGGVL